MTPVASYEGLGVDRVALPVQGRPFGAPSHVVVGQRRSDPGTDPLVTET